MSKNFLNDKFVDTWNIKLDESIVNILPPDSFMQAIGNINFREYCRGRAFDV